MARKIRGLLDETLQKVIALREAGSSWLKIQQEVNIDRRTAKRAYEEWQRSKSIDELKAARKDVAAEEFRNHLHCLITLAGTLIQILDVPASPNSVPPASDVLDKMWQLDSLRSCSPYRMHNVGATHDSRKLLLTSLKTHTMAKVRWDALNEWTQSWDKCKSALEKLQQETRKVMHNVIEQKQLLQKLKKGSREKAITERMANGVLHTVWEQILRPSDQFPVMEISPRADGQSEVLCGKDRFVAGIILGEADLANQVSQLCEWGAKNVLLSTPAEAVTQTIGSIREKTGELQRSLNPLLLGPLIMSTRCDLCPA